MIRFTQKNHCVIAILVVVLILLLLIFLRIGGHSFDPQAVSKITVTNGYTGNVFEIDDPAVIREISEQLDDVSPSIWIGPPAAGYRYTLKLQDSSGNYLTSIGIMSEKMLSYDHSAYLTNCNEILEYLTALES